MSLHCQSCGHELPPPVVDLGFLPPPNDYRKIGSDPTAQIWMPTQVCLCPNCQLVQMGYMAPKQVVFPITYPYLSGSTKQLRDNFADLAQEAEDLADLQEGSLVVDIGANDGTLLNAFPRDYRRLAIEPTNAINRVPGEILRIQHYFNKTTAQFVQVNHGHAKLIACTNCFAHVDNLHEFIDGVKTMLRDDGVFVTESHYLIDLLRTLQYDTIYHEHLRYYSLHSINYLLKEHNLEIFHVKRIPTHGGSIRVYACRKGKQIIKTSVDMLMNSEPAGDTMEGLLKIFANDILASKIKLLTNLASLKGAGARVAAIGAPSRAATVLNYCRIDPSLIEAVYEISTSPKLNHTMPGTSIPVKDEKTMWDSPPNVLLLLSWHIAEELKNKLREKGYNGSFIIPIS